MERLFFHGHPSDEMNYGKYQSDPEWQRLYGLLRHGYWHVTTAEGWAGICKSGAIRPNPDKSKARFTSADKSYSLVYNCVALFDFGSPTERLVIQNWGFARDVIGQTCPGIFLQLDKGRLSSRIIPNIAACGGQDGKYYHCVEHCEVWYPSDIPIGVITGRYLVSRGHDVGLELDLVSEEES